MARDRKLGPEAPQPQEEMTVVVLKFRGGSASLQRGFDTVSQAIATLGPAPQNGGHRAPGKRKAAELGSGDNAVIDADPDIEEADETLDDAVAETPDDKPKRTPTPPKYTFMNDFNLSPSGQPSLKDYCTGKDPKAETDRFLVASAWITRHGGEELFTGAHLFTVFRAMEWKTQVDMTQPLRTMKSKKSYFDNPSTGKWKMTVPGLAAADNIVKA